MELSSLSNAYITQSATVAEQDGNKTEAFKNKITNVSEYGTDKEISDACKEFEAYFLNIMFKEMRKTVNSSDGFIPKSSAETTFQEMMDDSVAKTCAENGGIGLAAFMYKQMIRERNTGDTIKTE